MSDINCGQAECKFNECGCCMCDYIEIAFNGLCLTCELDYEEDEYDD